MHPSTRTPEGEPNRCPVCGKAFVLEPSLPPGDAPCPHCGSLVWFPRAPEVAWTAGFPVFSVQPEEAHSKEQAVRVVVGRLVDAGCLRSRDHEGIVSAILKRERLGSTAIGRGRAIPHATHPGVEEVVGALAKFPGGVEFDALDGQPVYLLCLLVAPIHRTGDHLRALEAAARSLRGGS
jgi:mannitol/fructose-specific phosphotransferase system IIA component (Ntr-type)